MTETLPTVVYFGGNGHASGRLAGYYQAHEQLVAQGELAPLRTLEAPYPGFEGRPRAATLDAFLTTLEQALPSAPTLVVATGIGGLLALCLRCRGRLQGVTLVLHAPVLWGLEKRWMPRLLRLRPLQSMLHPLFAAGWYQRRFVRKQFIKPLDVLTMNAFFDGYAQCSAFPDLFAWLTPSLLRSLEQHIAGNPDCLATIRVWWGARDRVVSSAELAITEAKLGVQLPLIEFPEWGHYPMIEDPIGWARAIAEAVAEVNA